MKMKIKPQNKIRIRRKVAESETSFLQDGSPLPTATNLSHASHAPRRSQASLFYVKSSPASKQASNRKGTSISHLEARDLLQYKILDIGLHPTPEIRGFRQLADLNSLSFPPCLRRKNTSGPETSDRSFPCDID